MKTKLEMEIVDVKDNDDGSCTIVLDTTEKGREMLMQAGVTKILEDFIDANNDKLPLWTKLKLWWKTK